jgi:hypothetical protein
MTGPFSSGKSRAGRAEEAGPAFMRAKTAQRHPKAVGLLHPTMPVASRGSVKLSSFRRHACVMRPLYPLPFSMVVASSGRHLSHV